MICPVQDKKVRIDDGVLSAGYQSAFGSTDRRTGKVRDVVVFGDLRWQMVTFNT
jgi:hypothetical protein